MSFAAPKTPVSQIIHNKDNQDEPKKKTREDWRKAKELEEARKAGTAPAAVDEEGRDINPHIPQYISSAPWYYGASGPTLKHQRPQKDEEESTALQTKQIIKGVDSTRLVTKFRKGACENCGAITHKKKDCLERPRKYGAKYAESLVIHDEHIVDSNATDYDEKRDRWSAYDPASHKDIVDEFEKVEEAKRQLKADKLKDNPDAELSDEQSDEDKYVDEVDMPGTKVDSKQRITVRNLRIREDTAKYLRNLDPNSAYYDPKTRSMRDNPNPQLKPDEVEFAGENTVRYSGDTTKHSTAQLFAWEAHRKGVDVHLLAEPTKLELLQKDYNLKKEDFKSQTKDHILEKYGGEEHLQVPPKSLLLAQNENYIEYSRSGKVVKGMEKSRAISAYEEDVFPNNHKTIWGSFWHSGRWGYKCCKSFIKNSYCVSANKEAMESNDSVVTHPQTQQRDQEQHLQEQEEGSAEEEQDDDDDDESEPEQVDSPKKSSKKSKKDKKKKKKSKHKRREAEKKEEAKKKEEKVELDDRKRAYNSMYDVKAPTEEEIEEFMIKRTRDEDPMLQFMGK